MVMRIVCQSVLLLREKRKKEESEEIYSKPYLTLLFWLSFYLSLYQTVDHQRENNIHPLCPVLQSVSAPVCHPCALVI